MCSASVSWGSAVTKGVFDLEAAGFTSAGAELWFGCMAQSACFGAVPSSMANAQSAEKKFLEKNFVQGKNTFTWQGR